MAGKCDQSAGCRRQPAAILNPDSYNSFLSSWLETTEETISFSTLSSCALLTGRQKSEQQVWNFGFILWKIIIPLQSFFADNSIILPSFDTNFRLQKRI